ncbi:MAG TPA: hypothetical protein VFS76_20375 [Pyrinomonadaceae bacterium]|nr:hypothetical protein [Pyrinomonadaceae bacterium]
MKEITRRLYTKPVMLGMAFLVGVALVVGMFVTSKSTAAVANDFPVAAGNDEFETAGDGETYHNFQGAPIPAGFFGAGSYAYGGNVALVGVPLVAGSTVDTVIERQATVWSAGGSTPIVMTGLSLKSTTPITVTFDNGTPAQQWDVAVGLSAYKTSGGTMTINATSFDSTLKVWPKFTFTRVGGGSGPLVWDTGAPDGPGLTASATTVLDDAVIEPAPGPEPQPTIAPCTSIDTFEGSTKVNTGFSSAAATSSCAPVTLSSVNSPWVTCGNHGLCIPVPITEEERWARHRPRPKPRKVIVAAE